MGIVIPILISGQIVEKIGGMRAAKIVNRLIEN